MTENVIFPDWKYIVVYPPQGAEPQVLVESENYKSVIGGLAPGSKMPPHTEGPAIFHFLEGEGQMVVGDESYAVQAGATVVVPDGAARGITADTQLAFLAVRLPK